MPPSQTNNAIESTVPIHNPGPFSYGNNTINDTQCPGPAALKQ